MAPDHRHVLSDLAADVERRPVRAFDVLLVERPQPAPMLRPDISVAVEIVERRLRQRAPDRLEAVPVELAVDLDIAVKQVQELFPVAFGAAKQLCVARFLFRSSAGLSCWYNIAPDMKVRTMSGKWPSTSRMAAAAADGSRRSTAATMERCDAMSARISTGSRRNRPKYQNRIASLCSSSCILASGGFFEAVPSAVWNLRSISTSVRNSRLRITVS